MSPREIDAQIAMHIMGKSICVCHPLREMPRFNADDGKCLTCGNRLGGSYSTDPAASKQLKDKMWADGWRWVVQALANDRYVARFWRIRLEDEGNDETGTIVEGEAYDDAELMAVALAAMNAVGKPVQP